MDVGPMFSFSSVMDTVGVALRTQILFALDFTMNGAFVTFAVNGGFGQLDGHSVSDKQTLYDVLFALERENVTTAWNELTWTSYSVLSVWYFLVLLAGVILFFMDTAVLLTLMGCLSPTILVLATLLLSLEDERTSSQLSNFFSSDGSLNYESLMAYLYRLLIRGAYGYGAGRFYQRFRGSFLRFDPDNDEPAWIIAISNRGKYFMRFLASGRFQFFLPFIKTLCGSEFHIPKFPFLWALFLPLLTNELCAILVIIESYVVPYYLVLRLAVPGVLARLDLLRLQDWVMRLWVRLRVPLVFRSFFCARMALHLVYIVYVALLYGPGNDPYGVFAQRHLTTDWLWIGGAVAGNNNNKYDPSAYSMFISALEYLLTRSCETVLAVMATASVAAICGRWSGRMFRWILSGHRRNGDEQEDVEDDVDDGHDGVGSLTGALFFVLCVQTGLTSLPAEKRLWKLYRNLWLLGMAILHFVHHMVSTTMTRLCTHGRFHWTKHIRAILLGIFLLIAPCVFFKFCWRHSHWLNPWLISVALFATELAAKMLISFITYGLLLLDVFYPLAHADEALYSVKTAGAVFDFIFGVGLLINGIWILFYEQGGILRTMMICIHGYFNIYQRAKKGIAQLRRRRLAAQKINSLITASRERLQAAGEEVCAICYVELNGNEEDTAGGNSWIQSEVKVTACGHLLHSTCLIKWLYIRDTCPLCHQAVFDERTTSSADGNGNNDDELN